MVLVLHLRIDKPSLKFILCYNCQVISQGRFYNILLLSRINYKLFHDMLSVIYHYDTSIHETQLSVNSASYYFVLGCSKKKNSNDSNSLLPALVGSVLWYNDVKWLLTYSRELQIVDFRKRMRKMKKILTRMSQRTRYNNVENTLHS